MSDWIQIRGRASNTRFPQKHHNAEETMNSLLTETTINPMIQHQKRAYFYSKNSELQQHNLTSALEDNADGSLTLVNKAWMIKTPGGGGGER